VTALLSALSAALAAALIVGPRHRPLRQSRPATRALVLRALQRSGEGRAATLAVGLIVGLVGFAVGRMLVAAASCLAGVALFGALRSRRAQRRAAQRLAGTEALLDALAAELGSGAAPADAVAAVLPDLPPAIRVEMEAVGRALRSGGDAVAAWRQAFLLTSADALAAGFQVCEDSGASLATVLARLAAMAADDRRRRDEVAVALAGPRSSAVLLAGLPALGVLAGAGIGASPLPFLLQTPAGQLCLLLGVGLDVLGAWWVARLAASAGRPQRLP
jgi:tight adherence protein B